MASLPPPPRLAPVPGASALLDISSASTASIMAAYDALGGKADRDDALHAAVAAMLAKDVLYAPLAALCARFPAWLASARLQLPAGEYEGRGRQFQVYQRLVAQYEVEPDAYAKVVSLVQEAAGYGPPPRELVAELGGGLDLAADGRPLFPGLAEGGEG